MRVQRGKRPQHHSYSAFGLPSSPASPNGPPTPRTAKIGHFDEVCAKNSDGTETCVDGDDEAPATSPTQDESEPPEDTAPATTTTPVRDDGISSPAADDPVDEDEPTEPAEADPEAEELEEADEPLLPEPANDDHHPAEDLPATGTDG